MKPEFLLFWIAVGMYGASMFCYIVGLIAKSEKLFLAGFVSSVAGFLPHLAAITIRWIEGGVLPFISTSESISLGVFMAVLVLLITQCAVKKMRPLGVLVMPVAFVLMGWSGSLLKVAATSLVPAMQSAWIWIHIVGASTGFASVLTAAGTGLLYLLKEKRSGGIYDRLPDLQGLDNLSYRFIAGGFIMFGMMMVSGCFWANQVKGNYWNWDPVEVWSLISWLVYGIYLHLRITLGWRGRRLAWYALLALAAMITSYWGIPFVAETFHAGFRIEH